MRSDAIVVASVRFQNLAQVSFAQNNDVIQTLTPDRSDQPFGKAVLPRRPRRDGFVPNADEELNVPQWTMVANEGIAHHLFAARAI